MQWFGKHAVALRYFPMNEQDRKISGEAHTGNGVFKAPKIFGRLQWVSQYVCNSIESGD
jgi:hypothetical protein